MSAVAQPGPSLTIATQRQLSIVNLFSALAFLSLALFGLLEIYAEHKQQLGLIELAGSGAVALNVIGLRVTRNVDLARDLLLLSILSFLLVMLVSGGTQGTGIFWYFVFPVSAFFLAGKKRGAYWMLALVSATLVLGGLASQHKIVVPYSFVVVRQLMVSVSIVAIGIYAYEQAREKAEQQIYKERIALDTAKNEFLALASHQLRTPISAISWFTEMLLHGDAGTLNDTQQDYITQVYQSNQRSAAIVDAIITVSSLQTGTLATHLEPIDLVVLCRRVVRDQKKGMPQAEEVHITEHYTPNLPTVHGDAALMRIIVKNLFSNALKYTPSGGNVTVTVDKVKDALTVTSRGSLRITVADTGYGIPKSQQPKIFAKLFRATNIKAKDTDGTGLGLYIVKAILTQVGGRISFVSEENKGSTFTVLLPLEGMHPKGKK
ncbi:MAG TPA: HAMP domain-containing sensor histidine kinase [Candidatus Saccharimonadales bacterium]|nr:HAMP domain-containing sensor histidine kinase [Candidatus Saccharimonadales bacterium]